MCCGFVIKVARVTIKIVPRPQPWTPELSNSFYTCPIKQSECKLDTLHTFTEFSKLSHTFSAFCTLYQLFARFLNLYGTLSINFIYFWYLLKFSHIFAHFLNFCPILSIFDTLLIFWCAFKYFLRSEKNPIPKFSLKSSSIYIYEWLFSINKYLFN